jgi:flagellar hook-associated protein 1 FlgK
MSDLFTMLGITARALDAQRFGLDVAGQNLANLNTPGYTRRTAQLEEVPPLDASSAGGGVQVTALLSSRAPLIDAQLLTEAPAVARDSATAEHLATIDASLGLPGASLDAALTRFYNTYGTLAGNPSSSVARQQVVSEGQALAAAFTAMAARLDAARRSADAEIRSAAAQVNGLAAQLASLNAAISGASGAAAETLKDQQSIALASLSELAGIQAISRDDGTIDVTIGNGRALVVADRTYPIDVQSQPPNGFAALTTNGAATTVDLGSELTTGVSIDEETAMLMRFQRAYEANARFFQITDDTLDLLMQLVRA